MRAVETALLILTVPIASLTAQQPGSAPENRANFFTVDKEVALGNQIASDVRKQTRAVEDAKISDYVDTVGQRLAHTIPGTKFPFTFNVIAEDLCPATHEAESLPGGNIFVPAALLLETDSEAEFAGMLAHSMSHVVARHGIRQPSQTRASDLGTVPLIFMGGQSGLCSGGLGLAIPASFRATQRTYELEADALAIEIMAHANFDPAALVSYIQRVQPQESPLGPLSFLPTRNERVQSMKSVIDRLPPSNYEETSSAFQEIQQRIRPYVQPPRKAGVPTLRQP